MKDEMFWEVEKPILGAMGKIGSRIAQEGGLPNSLQVVLYDLQDALFAIGHIRGKYALYCKKRGNLSQTTEKSKSRRRRPFLRDFGAYGERNRRHLLWRTPEIPFWLEYE